MQPVNHSTINAQLWIENTVFYEFEYLSLLNNIFVALCIETVPGARPPYGLCKHKPEGRSPYTGDH